MASKKKTTAAPRIALYLPVDAQGLYTHCNASWAGIKGDPGHFANPFPPGNEVDDDLAKLGAALQAAASGDPVALAALKVAADKVRQDWEMLGKYVQGIVRAGPIEDAAAIISSVLMYVSNVGKRPPKPELQAKQGAISTTVLLIALAVESAMVYTWEYSLDQQAWTAVPQTAQARTSITGLTPGKVYYFRFRVFKRDGTTTDASQVVSFMVK